MGDLVSDEAFDPDEPYGDLDDDAYERAKDARLEREAEAAGRGAVPRGLERTISEEGGP